MGTFVVNLPNDLKPFVESQVAAGDYASADEFVRRLVENALTEAQADHIETLIQQGLDSGEPQEVTPETWQSLRRRLRERIAQKHVQKT
jgi:antitoxin ParD1/3/4